MCHEIIEFEAWKFLNVRFKQIDTFIRQIVLLRSSTV